MVEDVWQVTLETMRRVRANLEVIMSRLHADGYEFYDYDEKRFTPVMGPDDSFEALIDALDHEFAPLPLSLKAFVTVVGDVCFLGNHPSWGIDFPPKGPSTYIFDPISNPTFNTKLPKAAIWYPDPLVVEFRGSRYAVTVNKMMANYRSSLESWNPEVVDTSIVRLEFAPDEVHKAGYSGGTPYYMILPESGADGRIVMDAKGEVQFVDYLRHAILYWGEFPGFEKAPAGADHGVIERLKAGLISF
jgi:hypothetical protein